jgi:hypothetical protein
VISILTVITEYLPIKMSRDNVKIESRHSKVARNRDPTKAKEISPGTSIILTGCELTRHRLLDMNDK